jgi:3',5'-cyclic AMP phosphodiesterase CpdA
LDRDLAENENKIVIVMLHHCLIEHPGGPAYWMCDNADQIKQILKRHSVKVIITGHTHITEIKEEGGLYEINCPATCSYPCAYRVLKLSDRKLEINTVWYSNEAIRQIAKREYITALWNKMRGELAIAEGKACDRHAVIEVVDRAAILPAASVNFNPAKPNSSKAIEGAP